jgi:hypothetical protein
VAVAELRFGHVDSALMMLRHHRYEVMVDITRGLHGHVIHHFSERIAIEYQAELGLTIYNAAAVEHGLLVALWWFIPGMALAIGYSVLVYRRIAGKVA